MLFGIATILVLMVHATQYTWPSGTEMVKKIFAEGGIVVDIFLLLSGIGMYKSYQNCVDVKEFYKRRIRRIFPVFIPIGGIFYAIIVLQRGEGIIDYIFHLSTLSCSCLDRDSDDIGGERCCYDFGEYRMKI